MNTQYKDTFFESVEKLVWYDTKLWKVWEFITSGLPNFFKNIWKFRKELYNHQWWDYHFTLEMLYRSLTIMVNKLELEGIEEDESRMKKVGKIYRALELIKHKLDDDYVNRAEMELGEISYRPIRFEPVEGSEGLYSMVDDDTPEEKKHISEVFKRAKQIEETEWKELWEIFKGTKFSKKFGWAYDGSDMRGWWD
ncbi:hypothetical protein EBV26_20285 [bacterium]|nr:hypothetical protein [bacterium]